MKQLKSSQPIGVFDSGVGGLTVTKALVDLMPNEDIIYFGDTAHAPYGDKSTAAIQAYSVKIAQMLLHENCKLILIACNSASAAAYELLHEYVGEQALLVNVIDPVVNHLRENSYGSNIGLIGTKQTINSNIYTKKIDELGLDIKLHAHATPLLVPAIEEGLADSVVIKELLAEYLAHDNLQAIDALILGCTHYPLIKQQISAYYKNKVTILDSSTIVAAALRGLLESYALLNQSTGHKHQFYISDYTDAFAAATKLFFSADVELARYPLWDA